MHQCFRIAGHDSQDQENLSAVDWERATEANIFSETHFKPFAELLQQLSQAHDHEVAQLSLEIERLKGSFPPPVIPHVCTKHTDSEMVVASEDTRLQTNVFADTSLPLSLSQVTPILVNSDFLMKEDMEVAQERAGEPGIAPPSKHSSMPSAQRLTTSAETPELSSLSEQTSLFPAEKDLAEHNFLVVPASSIHNTDEQCRVCEAGKPGDSTVSKLMSSTEQPDALQELHAFSSSQRTTDLCKAKRSQTSVALNSHELHTSSPSRRKADLKKATRSQSGLSVGAEVPSSSPLLNKFRGNKSQSGLSVNSRVSHSFSHASNITATASLFSVDLSSCPALERWHRLVFFAKHGSDYVKLEKAWQVLAHENLAQRKNGFQVTMQKIKGEMLRSGSSLGVFDFHNSRMSQGLDTWFQWFQQIAQRLKTKNAFILHPNSWFRMMWDLSGVILLIHDVVMIPLQVFDSGTGGVGDEYMNFWAAVDFFASIFWTCDIFISFVTAFYSDEGFLEVSHWKIAHHYLKSWFPLDLGIVTIDWIGYLLHFESEVGYLRLGKAISRFLRVLRLLRLMKMSEKLNEVIEAVNSEYILTLMGVLKLLIGIIMVNHYIACVWYWLSQIDDTKTWYTKFLKEQEDFDYAYVTSMHWSLTQFTPASMEVHPTNTYERIYTIFVIIGAMLTFSSFVSSITDAMTHLRTINAKKSETNAAFRQYFSRNKVSLELARQVWHVRRNNVRANKSRMQESELPALKFLPSHLREMLRVEVFNPILQSHPLFRLLFSLCPDAAMQICNEAMSERQLLAGEELKEIAHPVSKMLFVCGGVLMYFCDESQDRSSARPHLSESKVCASDTTTGATGGATGGPRADSTRRLSRRLSIACFSARSDQSLPLPVVKINPGEWACEVALWSGGGAIKEPFCGGDTGCELVLLSATKFRSIIQKHKERDGLQLMPYYAQVFVDTFNRACFDPHFKDILFNDETMIRQFLEVATTQMQERYESLFAANCSNTR